MYLFQFLLHIYVWKMLPLIWSPSCFSALMKIFCITQANVGTSMLVIVPRWCFFNILKSQNAKNDHWGNLIKLQFYSRIGFPFVQISLEASKRGGREYVGSSSKWMRDSSGKVGVSQIFFLAVVRFDISPLFYLRRGVKCRMGGETEWKAFWNDLWKALSLSVRHSTCWNQVRSKESQNWGCITRV